METNYTFEEILNTAIKEQQKDIHTALPARVLKFDAAKQTVDVQITIKRRFTDKGDVFYPPLLEVPLQELRAGGFAITMPVSVGDTGLLVFIERSIDEWQVNGAEQVPEDVRMHSVSDAVFFPTLHTDRNPIKNHSKNLEIRTESANGKISITPSGKIEIEKDGDKVLKTVSDTLGVLSTTTVTITAGSSAGTYAIDTQSDFASLKEVIDRIKI